MDTVIRLKNAGHSKINTSEKLQIMLASTSSDIILFIGISL